MFTTIQKQIVNNFRKSQKLIFAIIKCSIHSLIIINIKLNTIYIKTMDTWMKIFKVICRKVK